MKHFFFKEVIKHKMGPTRLNVRCSSIYIRCSNYSLNIHIFEEFKWPFCNLLVVYLTNFVGDCSARDKQWTASEAIQATRSKGYYCVQHFLLDKDTIIEN